VPHNRRCQTSLARTQIWTGIGAKEYVMKIGNTAVSPNVAPVGQPATRGAADGARTSDTSSAGNASGTGEASATVSLSGAAKALLDGVDGTFDANKVEQVRQSIADGSYKVNAEAIADKLLANAQEVLGKSGSAR
jgi:negative regulator of flagellin synthesis FlgM